MSEESASLSRTLDSRSRRVNIPVTMPGATKLAYNFMTEKYKIHFAHKSVNWTGLSSGSSSLL